MTPNERALLLALGRAVAHVTQPEVMKALADFEAEQRELAAIDDMSTFLVPEKKAEPQS